MSVTDVNAVTPTTRDVVVTALRDETQTWLFVAKTLLAFFLTGWLAMRFALDQPSTAMLTTILVANRQSGMVLAKSFYRAIGTVVGALAALVIVGLFPQERVLFLGALSLWVGLCAGGATLNRNFKAYAFVLAGYTAALIVIPVVNNPLAVFDGAVARISEVLLGIVVSGVVSDLVFPSHIRAIMRRAAREQYAHFMQFVERATTGKTARGDIEKAHLRFVRDAVTLEDMRSSVIFEDPEARARSGHILLFNQRFMAASTSLQSLHHLINRLQRNGRNVPAAALIQLYAPLGEALDIPIDADTSAKCILPRLDDARRAIGAHIPVMRASLQTDQDVQDFDTGADLVHRFADELYAFTDTAALLQAPGGVTGSAVRIRFTRGNDIYGAWLAVLRASMTMAVLSFFWIVLAWPSGASAMVIATVFAGLFASAPNPIKAVNAFLIGYVLGATASFICEFYILTHMDGYGLLIAGCTPFLMMGALLMAWPSTTGIGTGYLIGFTNLIALKNPMVYDPVRFLNESIAQLVGVGSASVAFTFVPSTIGSPWFIRRQFERLRRQVCVAAEAPLPGLIDRFESTNHDLFSQIVAQTVRGSDESRSLLAWALSVHETGRALIQLRYDLAAKHWPEGVHRAITPAIDALKNLYDSPTTSAYTQARDALIGSISQLNQFEGTQRLLVHLHLIRLALLDDKSVLADYMPRKKQSEEVGHAT
ncbi:FUSC family protein [Dyella dinghuensis]|uniref:FUSC family protein n=1 Tax=Dyella dinghuensis TaxID=1920169 RepID=A0A3S0PHN8_9GAMM|nr:FUSC family protein [Dyella dinghuensis]RUL65914.1 FUSC family protein [Dyella dinghuensis]